MIIGQKKIRANLARMVSNNQFPQFSIILGGMAWGKRLIASEVARMIDPDYTEYESPKIATVREITEECMTLRAPRVFVFTRCQYMTHQAQNAILKLTEEPPKNAYIIMTADSRESVLPTLRSRARILELEPYTKEDVEELTDDPLLLKIADSPGMVKKYVEVDFETVADRCSKVVSSIGKVSASNTFNVLKDIEPEALPLVIPILLVGYRETLTSIDHKQRSTKIVAQIEVLYKYKRQIENRSVNTQNALEQMFLELREVAR